MRLPEALEARRGQAQHDLTKCHNFHKCTPPGNILLLMPDPLSSLRGVVS
jgi:hypothetical protein